MVYHKFFIPFTNQLADQLVSQFVKQPVSHSVSRLATSSLNPFLVFQRKTKNIADRLADIQIMAQNKDLLTILNNQ